MTALVRSASALLRRLAFAAVLAVGSAAWADTVHLKDGSSLEGVVVRETDTFIQIKVKIGGLESVKTLLRSEIKKIEKDVAAPTPAAAPAATAPSTSTAAPGNPPASNSATAKPPTAAPPSADKALATAARLDGSGTRIAILNFGPPSSWHDEVDSTVGIQINAHAWAEAVKLLEKDKVNIVVVRINSGGGLLAEMEPFQNLFEKVYKKKFRTVGWVESAISCAAMSPYALEEFYFMPNGSLGACTAWGGALQNVEGPELEMIIAQMERVSGWANRSPAIMRSMQVQVPLSATIDEKTGEVTWFQDTSGQYLLNRPGQIFTFTANDAVKFKFARGIAATRDELARVMGINEPVWAGDEAIRFLDQNMRETDKTEKRWQVKYREFELHYAYAEQAQDRTDRGKFAGRALQAIKELRQMFATNPNFGRMNNINEEWFRVREDAIKKLLRNDR
jgi:hypothetical protein